MMEKNISVGFLSEVTVHTERDFDGEFFKVETVKPVSAHRGGRMGAVAHIHSLFPDGSPCDETEMGEHGYVWEVRDPGAENGDILVFERLPDHGEEYAIEYRVYRVVEYEI